MLPIFSLAGYLSPLCLLQVQMEWSGGSLWGAGSYESAFLVQVTTVMSFACFGVLRDHSGIHEAIVSQEGSSSWVGSVDLLLRILRHLGFGVLIYKIGIPGFGCGPVAEC